jgi:PAS domain S-box-containing protein
MIKIKSFIRQQFLVIIISVFSLLIFTVIGIISYTNNQKWLKGHDQVTRSRVLLVNYAKLVAHLNQAESAQREYMLLHDEKLLQNYRIAFAKVDSIIFEIDSLSAGDPIRDRQLFEVDSLVVLRVGLLEKQLQARDTLSVQSALADIRNGRGKAIMENLRQEVEELEQKESAWLNERRGELMRTAERINRTHLIGASVGIGLLLWAFGLLWYQMEHRKKDLFALQSSHNKLEHNVAERTQELNHSLGELKLINDKLNKSNEAQMLLIEQLTYTKDQLNLALDISDMALWEWDVRTNKVDGSDNLEKIFGLRPGEIQTMFGGNYNLLVSNLVHPGDNQSLTDVMKVALDNKMPFSRDFRVYRPDGSLRWLSSQGRGIYDPNGYPVKMLGTVTDVTEQRLAEEKIKESEEKYRDLFDNNPLPAWVYDIDTFGFVEVNEAAISHYGFTKEEFFLMKIFDICAEEDLEEFTYLVKQADFTEAKSYSGEWRNVKKDETVIDVVVTTYLLPEREGRRRKIVLVNDITERKRAERALIESEAKFRRLFESNMIGIMFYDFNGAILDANDRFLEMVGYSQEDLEQGKLDWIKMTPPEYNPELRKDVNEQIVHGTFTPYEKEYIGKDSSRVPVLVGGATLTENGNTGVAFVLDITKRKKAEEQLKRNERLLQEIFEASADALVLVDAETFEVQNCNNQTLDLFGYPDKSSMTGVYIHSHRKTPFTEAEMAEMKKRLKVRSYYSAEVEYVSQTGREFWGNLAITPLAVEDSTYYLLRIADITERRILEEATKRALAIIEKDNVRKTMELEEARSLQLSMLPQSPPKLDTLTMGMFMKTSSEVGGDYYDYKLAPDGTLTVAIGDATGHGLKAGILVATVKSYFQTLANECDATTLLLNISEGIRNMQIRGMYMGLTIIKIKDNSYTIASSGMPPLYLYKAASGEVDTILLKGLFLGTPVIRPFETVTIMLDEGDILLAMSDGLAESFNESREILDYTNVKESFQEHAHLPVDDVITSLVSLGEKWSGGKPNEDDITLIVIKSAKIS